jgi:hypothetical protein
MMIGHTTEVQDSASLSFLPIGVRWEFSATDYGTERRLTVDVQPAHGQPFSVSFDPFPRGFPRGFVTAANKGENHRRAYLERIAQDRALRECFERFGIEGGA